MTALKYELSTQFSQGLEKNGGVHVIVTFLPEDAAEHKQIMGRTCRQDNPGEIIFLSVLVCDF